MFCDEFSGFVVHVQSRECWNQKILEDSVSSVLKSSVTHTSDKSI